MRQPLDTLPQAMIIAASLLLAVFASDIVSAQSAPRNPATGAPMENQPFMSTKSGLKYRILRAGNGAKPTAANTVTVHYKGWLPDPNNGSQGQEFDSSYKRGEPISFPLSGVIKGWTEGMQLVGQGGMIELEIPPQLGYGARGAGGAIPPNATLRFIVELLEVK